MARFISQREESLYKAPGSLIFVGQRKMEIPETEIIHFNADGIRELTTPDWDALRDCRKPGEVSWVNIHGLHDPEIVQKIGEIFDLHPLLLEDVLNTTQQPLFEEYSNCLFIVLKMLRHDEATGRFSTEQLSLVVGDHYLISFQEERGDVFGPLRDRLFRPTTKIRHRGADYLAYAMMDAVVDNYILVVERFGTRIEEMEKRLFNGMNDKLLAAIHHNKMEINYLRKTIRPVRDLAARYAKSESALLTEYTVPYIKDLVDHASHAAEAIETYQVMLNDQQSTYHTGVSNRLNDVMRILTIFSVIFIPITFLAGVYGMNFEYLPELNYKIAYPIFWGISIIIALIMIFYFKWKKWL